MPHFTRQELNFHPLKAHLPEHRKQAADIQAVNDRSLFYAKIIKIYGAVTSKAVLLQAVKTTTNIHN